MERQEGYYWVKVNGMYHIGYYFIELGDDWWSLCNDDNIHKDDYFEFINENRIKAPGELPD